MKKIFLKISAGTTLAVAIALSSCNNDAEVKKQTDEQNAKIQTLVDEKLNGLQEQVNTECTAKVDSAANAEFAVWQEEQAAAKKGGKKPAPKPKPKPETKKDDKKVDVGQKDDSKKIDVGQKGTGGKKIDVGQKKQ